MKRRRRFTGRTVRFDEPAPIDPSVFGDPVAEKTEWTPRKRGGTNFCTHKLVRDRPDQLVFKASLGATLFTLVFFLGGCIAVIVSVNLLLSQDPKGTSDHPWMLLLMGLLFALLGGFLRWHWLRPITFDKTRGSYWKGRTQPHSTMRPKDSTEAVKLDQIHAIQLISERMKSSSQNSGRSSYRSFEINLVLENGSRLCVVDHGNERKILEQAQQLSDFLGCPLWIGY